MSAFLRKAHRRQVSIPDLIRWALPPGSFQSARRGECLRRLAKKGFLDALNAQELVECASDAAHLPSLEEELAGLEYLSTLPQSRVADLVRYKLGVTYGDALVMAFLGPFGPETEAETMLQVPDVALPQQRGQAHERQSQGLPAHQARIFATTLLSRVEQRSGSRGTMLEVMLSQVASRAVLYLEQAVVPLEADPSTMELSSSSPAGRMWEHVVDWTGKDGGRRAALDRALRHAWCLLDAMEKGDAGPPKTRQLPLLLARRVGSSRPHDDDEKSNVARIFESEPEAILSANWSERPLAVDGLWFEEEGSGKRPVDWESILRQGAIDLIQLGADDKEGRAGERFLEVWYPLREAARFRAWVPIEAALLRVPPESLGTALTLLKRLHGGLDGRTHAFLEELERSPADLALRKRYARHSVCVLWRAIRDDPSYLVRWPQRPPIPGDEPRPSLAVLCEVLHEPASSIGATSSHLDLVRDRMETLKELDPYVAGDLLLQITEAPGVVAALPIKYGIALRHPEHEVEMALRRIEQPEIHAAAALARDVMLLRVAAVRKPILELSRGSVDLRAILPERFERLLESLRVTAKATPDHAQPNSHPGPADFGTRGRPGSEPGMLVRHEADLLRACGGLMRRVLIGTQRTERDWLWLTYRLHAWLVRQLEAIDPDARRAGIANLAAAAPLPRAADDGREGEPSDLFNPMFFQARGFDYRLAVVLFAFAAMDELASDELQPTTGNGNAEAHRVAIPKISSPGLEKHLLELAKNVRTQPFASTWFSWSAPDNVSDLALAALLSLNPSRVSELDDEALLQRIRAWPRELSEIHSAQSTLVYDLARVLGLIATALSGPVREALEDRLLQLGEGDRERELRWLGLSSLFGSGAAHLHAIVGSLIEHCLTSDDAVFGVSRYLRGVASIDSERLESEVFRLYGAWSDQLERGTEVLSSALGVLIVHGAEPLRSDATRVLRLLAERRGLDRDDRLRNLMQHLRIDPGVQQQT